MIRWIVGSCLKSRVLVIAVAAVIMVFGIAQVRDMPVDVFPEFEPPIVDVQTEALGLSAPEVEDLVTLPLEDLLADVRWLQTIRSESIPGLSRLRLIFEPETKLADARLLVQERISLALLAQLEGRAQTFPNVSSPPLMLQPLSATSRILKIGLYSKQLSPIQLSVLARWTIQPSTALA